MSTTPPQAPVVKATVDAMMRHVAATLGHDAVAKLQAAARGGSTPSVPPAGPSGGKEVPGAAQSAEKPTETSAAKPANLPVNESSAVPPELIFAMLQAQLEGHPAAADDLAELGSDPEAMAEFLADRDAGTQGMMSSRMFAAMTRTFSAHGERWYGWASDPTPRSPSRATNSDTGKHLYGEQARRALAWQAREDKGEEHPKSTKQALIEHKQAQEPKREEARKAYKQAIDNPGSVKPEQLASLAEHLHTLTRDEVRANLRTLEKSAGGKLKHDLVDALLSHVRESAIAHHEGKLDPLGMGLDQDEATRNIQALEETRPGAKKTPNRQTDDEKTTHADRMAQRHAVENAVEGPVKVADTGRSLADKGSPLAVAKKVPDEALTEHLNRKEGKDGSGNSVGGGGGIPSGDDRGDRNDNPEDKAGGNPDHRSGAGEGLGGGTGEDTSKPPSERMGGDAGGHGSDTGPDAKSVNRKEGGDGTDTVGTGGSGPSDSAPPHRGTVSDSPVKEVPPAGSGDRPAAEGTQPKERGGVPPGATGPASPDAVAGGVATPKTAPHSPAEATASIKDVLHKIRGYDIDPGEVKATLDKLDSMSAPHLLEVANSLDAGTGLTPKSPKAKVLKQVKEMVVRAQKSVLHAIEGQRGNTYDERLAQHRKQVGYVPAVEKPKPLPPLKAKPVDTRPYGQRDTADQERM